MMDIRIRLLNYLVDHKPAGPLRGGKYSLFDGGTRVVFIVRWNGKIKPGTTDALFSQIDLLASFASLTGQTLQKMMHLIALIISMHCLENQKQAGNGLLNMPEGCTINKR